MVLTKTNLWIALGLAICLATPVHAEPSTLAKLNTQAAEFYRQGKYSEAIRVGKEALAEAEKNLGDSPRDFATALSNLAEYQRAQGNYADAEDLLKRALTIDQKLFNDHPDVATDLNNLGLIYDSLHRYADAEQEYKQALAMDEKILGPEAADVAVDLNNLAEAYRAQDKLAEAEPLYKRALTIWEKKPEENSRAIATVLNNLAALYIAQGKPADAEPLLSRALPLWRESSARKASHYDGHIPRAWICLHIAG